MEKISSTNSNLTFTKIEESSLKSQQLQGLKMLLAEALVPTGAGLLCCCIPTVSAGIHLDLTLCVGSINSSGAAGVTILTSKLSEARPVTCKSPLTRTIQENRRNRTTADSLFVKLRALKFVDLVDFKIQRMYRAKKQLLPESSQKFFEKRESPNCISGKEVNLWKL